MRASELEDVTIAVMSWLLGKMSTENPSSVPPASGESRLSELPGLTMDISPLLERFSITCKRRSSAFATLRQTAVALAEAARLTTRRVRQD
ncbi:MAG: hypothetical protein A3F69_00535 [Acidobacteria bacterium RIFCSPLOWO2_12_FULL_66_10]|nr:MAG: hypothetical protein A3F69_00535 [Acidobacteria bacterium RIFCSPLOWO2_12_FULL_66_10]